MGQLTQEIGYYCHLNVLFLCITEYQEKIRSCKEKIDKSKAETITDDELNALQNRMEEKLREEKQLRQELR